MKAPRPSLLVLLRFLAILVVAFFIILALHVEPAQGTILLRAMIDYAASGG